MPTAVPTAVPTAPPLGAEKGRQVWGGGWGPQRCCHLASRCLVPHRAPCGGGHMKTHILLSKSKAADLFPSFASLCPLLSSLRLPASSLGALAHSVTDSSMSIPGARGLGAGAGRGGDKHRPWGLLASFLLGLDRGDHQQRQAPCRRTWGGRGVSWCGASPSPAPADGPGRLAQAQRRRRRVRHCWSCTPTPHLGVCPGH